MIYLDSSVVLATLFGEDKRPSDLFWYGPRLASRLMDLEVRVRYTSRLPQGQSIAGMQQLLSRVRFVEISERSVPLLYSDPPRSVRTLDAIHLATLEHLNRGPRNIPLATYDRRLAAAAEAMGFQVIAP